MYRAHLLGMMLLSAGGSLLIAQDDQLKSGPKAGVMMPKPFPVFNVNGPNKDRPHCLVCKFALNPAVVIFAREPVEGKDAAFNDLLAKLDEVCVEFDERAFSVGVVILSADARDSTNNAELKEEKEKFEKAIEGIAPGLLKATALNEEAARAALRDEAAYEDAKRIAERDKDKPEAAQDAKQRKAQAEKSVEIAAQRKMELDKLLSEIPAAKLKELTVEYVKFGARFNTEAEQRKKLVENLSKRAEKLKHVVISCYPEEGPKGYDLNPKAEITVLFYERMKVIANYSYGPGAMEGKHVEEMVKRIREELPLRKKQAESK